MWRIWRRWHRVGENSKADVVMEELRTSINELEQGLANEEPDNDDSDAGTEDEQLEDPDDNAAIEDTLVLHDEAVEEENEVAILVYGDPAEQLAADAHVLGTTVEALRKLDITKASGKVSTVLMPLSFHVPAF